MMFSVESWEWMEASVSCRWLCVFSKYECKWLQNHAFHMRYWKEMFRNVYIPISEGEQTEGTDLMMPSEWLSRPQKNQSSACQNKNNSCDKYMFKFATNCVLMGGGGARKKAAKAHLSCECCQLLKLLWEWESASGPTLVCLSEMTALYLS